jgi:hypothetical protein
VLLFLNTIALDKNVVTDANEDGVPVTVTLAGANGTGYYSVTNVLRY